MRFSFPFLLIVALTVPGVLCAGNSRSFFLGDEAALTGGAGIAVSADSGSLWYNPAGLGGLKLGRMELTGTVYSAKLRKMDGVLVSTLPNGRYTADARADDFGSVPTSLVFVRHGNDQLSYGLAWYQTRDAWFDFRADLQKPFSNDGRVWSEGVEYHQRAYVYHIGPSLGVQLSPKFKIGASLYFLYSNFNASLRAFIGITDPEVDPRQDGIIAVTEMISNMGLGIMLAGGLQWQVSDHWHLGLVLRTPTFQVWQSSDSSSLDSDVRLEDDELTSIFDYEITDGSKFEFKQAIPMEAQFGAVYRDGSNWIGLEAAVRPPLEEMNQKTLWNVSLGGRINLTPIVSFGAGLFTDNASAKKMKPTSLDSVSDRYGVTTGLEFKTPLIVKGKSTKESGKKENQDNQEKKKEKKEKQLIWTTTIALSYSIEFARYIVFDVDLDRDEPLVLGDKLGIFHQGFLYLGTALYF